MSPGMTNNTSVMEENRDTLAGENFPYFTVLQTRSSNRDNLLKIYLFFNKNIHCDPSLEPSQQDGSNEGSQCMFY